MNRKSATWWFIRLVTVCLIVTPILLGGSGCSYSSTEAKPDLGLTLKVFIDRSGSTTGYPGGYEKIQSDYQDIGNQYATGVMVKSKHVHVTISDFVRNTSNKFDSYADSYEEISGPLSDAINSPPFSKDVASETRFSDLIRAIGQECRDNPHQQFLVLVLTDGHPDDTFKEIAEAAKSFKGKVPNLKSLLIAPVAPDMKYRWADKLRSSLAPLGSMVQIKNAEDYQGAVDALKNLGESK
jgi:hypothetical protein